MNGDYQPVERAAVSPVIKTEGVSDERIAAPAPSFTKYLADMIGSHLHEDRLEAINLDKRGWLAVVNALSACAIMEYDEPLPDGQMEAAAQGGMIEPRVLPLVWIGADDFARSITPFGTAYSVYPEYGFEDDRVAFASNAVDGRFPTMQAAKEAVQRFHEAQVFSAIEVRQ